MTGRELVLALVDPRLDLNDPVLLCLDSENEVFAEVHSVEQLRLPQRNPTARPATRTLIVGEDAP